MTRMIPVIWGANPLLAFHANNEFGPFAVVLADSFAEAYEEALHVMADNDGQCDHGGVDLGPLAAGVNYFDADPAKDCDCTMTDDGRYVWDVHLTLTAIGSGDVWIAEHGLEAEEVPSP